MNPATITQKISIVNGHPLISKFSPGFSTRMIERELVKNHNKCNAIFAKSKFEKVIEKVFTLREVVITRR